MKHTTKINLFFTGVAGIIGGMLLLLPVVVAQTGEARTTRTIDVTLSRYAFSPERIEVRLGEPVRLNVVSNDVAHGFRVRALGVNARIPGDGTAVAVELTPKEAGTFEITCSEYCGSGHRRMKALLVVTSAADAGF